MEQNITTITIFQAIQGNEPLDSTIILSLIVLSLGLAFGMEYGFNRIYSSKWGNRFARYKSELILNFKKDLNEIALSKKGDKDFNNEINRFVEGWQLFQNKISTNYDKLMTWRKRISVIFVLSAISYFIRLIRSDLFLFVFNINFLSNLMFILGSISIFIFVYKLMKIQELVSKWETENYQNL